MGEVEAGGSACSTLHHKVLARVRSTPYTAPMASPRLVPPTSADDPPALHARAMDNLSFIRQTMERATAFTAVPGWGGVGMGLLALGAAAVAETRLTPTEWLV